jgi:MFS family permease
MDGGPDMLMKTEHQSWWSEINPQQRRALVAATLGWVLDNMDVLMYAIVLGEIIRHFGVSAATAGALNSLTLMSSAFGGVIFGILADRYGRTWSMMASILVYSVFTALCGFSQTITQLAVFRLMLGLGIGGEWSTGAALISETWPDKHRGKAFGIMQSGFAVGYALAALVTAIVLPRWGWRAVFFVGILPALFTFWIRRNVAEPEAWIKSRRELANSKRTRPGFGRLFQADIRRSVVVSSILSICAMFASWGLFLWIPPLLSLPPERGGAGLGPAEFPLFLFVMHSGSFAGYLAFGVLADRFSPKKIYLTYVAMATVLVIVYAGTRNPTALFFVYAGTRNPTALFFVGPLVGFFGAGHFSGYGILTGGLFPTSIRATAQGFSYNIGRGISAIAPFTVGKMVDMYGFTAAFYLTAVFYFLTFLALFMVPERPASR